VSAVYSPAAAIWLAHQHQGWPATAEDRALRCCYGSTQRSHARRDGG